MSDIHSFISILISERIRLIETVCIFVSRTIFIDEDLSLPGINLRIVSPKWEVIGERTINLDGANGAVHSRQKADDGIGAGNNGQDGKPGLPGKSGGTFFGIGEIFINGAQLTITANGGNGSPGQHGGDGQNGKKGSDAEKPRSEDSPSHEEIVKGLTFIGGFLCKKTGGANSATGKNFHAYYRINGGVGKKGGNGGNGGEGGEGGKAGVVDLYELNEVSGISRHNNRGSKGRDGNGGKGGAGGKGGDHILVLCQMRRPACSSDEITEWTFQSRQSARNDTSGLPGSNGIDGGNRSTSHPEPAKIISKPFKIVNSYKIFLQKYFNCRFRSSLLYFNKLNDNAKVKSLYNTAGFDEKLQTLE